MMLTEIINQGLVRYCGSYNNNSTAVSLYLISFMLEKYIFCDVCGLTSQSCESNNVLYITPTYTSSMQELIMQERQQKWEKSCFRCQRNTWHVKSNCILQFPNYLIILVNRFKYTNNNVTKDRCSSLAQSNGKFTYFLRGCATGTGVIARYTIAPVPW